MGRIEYEDYHHEVAEVLAQGLRGDYIDFVVPIDRATAEHFHNHLTNGVIDMFKELEETSPRVLYDAQRECHPEGLYKTLANKFEKVALQQSDEGNMSLNRREIHALGQILLTDHIHLQTAESQVQQYHQVGASMFLELACDFEDAGGSYDQYLYIYFNRVLGFLWESTKGERDEYEF